MIVRISTEGQYELADGDVAGLNELDNEAVVGLRGRRRGVASRTSSGGCSTSSATKGTPRAPTTS